MNKFLILLILISTVSCQISEEVENNVITTDIELFWNMYDQIIQKADTLKQVELLESLYIKKGSVGLQKIIEARNYTSKEYISLINKYPEFWKSIRENTYKSKGIAKELNRGIKKLKAIYPELKPAKIYFTIGAMRTNGTTQDNLVLIGSELAMADSETNISEFEGRTKKWLETYFGTNPINGLVLLNIHEYVHTQQNTMPGNLLHQVLYEGVAEFVSVKAMGVPSKVPAIEFGKNNPDVKRKFEAEMFYEKTYEWLWSSAPNEFDVRDLGYYIGYEIAEQHYEQANDKRLAIKELIEIDYSKPKRVDTFIDKTNFFSKSISLLRTEDKNRRPKVIAIKQFKNYQQNVHPNTKQITIEFSEPLNGYNTGIDYGNTGEKGFPKIQDRQWSENSKSWTLEVELEPEKRYQILITHNFRTKDGIPLNPYLIDFKTGMN